jgi:nitrogen regulatory protein P-II 1
MKMLTAIVRPEKLDAVQAVLQPQEACLVCIGHSTDYQADPARAIVYRGVRHQFRPSKLRLEIIVEDQFVDEVIDSIIEAAATGGADHLGDGAVFVTPLAQCTRIGASERQALAESRA